MKKIRNCEQIMNKTQNDSLWPDAHLFLFFFLYILFFFIKINKKKGGHVAKKSVDPLLMRLRGFLQGGQKVAKGGQR